jgi:hypothetical protein
MNDNTQSIAVSPSAASEFPRCQHRMRKGRCRELVSDPASGLCPRHAAAQKKDRDAANLAATLIGDTQEFTSAVAINRSLGELYKLLARDEIAPRRAAVMAYTGSLLLRTLPAIEHELGLDAEEHIRVDLGDLPRPDHGSPEPVSKSGSHSPATEGAAAYARYITQPLPGDQEEKPA